MSSTRKSRTYERLTSSAHAQAVAFQTDDLEEYEAAVALISKSK